ncbi:MAG: hypothetical protein QW279_10140 [Candidatus Jordarchaeaceae archaeon]
MLKGKRTVAEESVFNFIPRDKSYVSSFYQNFLPFDEDLDEKMELAYELRIYGEKISSCFFVFTKDIIDEKNLDAKILSIMYSFNLNTDYEKMRYDALEDAFLNIIGGEYFTRIRKVKEEKNVLLIEAGKGITYIAVIALRGSPDESLDPDCMSLFVNSIRNLDLDVSFVVPFRFVKTGDSDYMLKKDLKVRIKVNGKFPVRYFETSPYLVVRGSSIETIRNHAKRVCIAANAAFSGIKKRISVDFLDSNMIMKFLHHIICRRLLPEREILSIQNLGIYLRLPNQSVVGALKPQALIPKREMKGVDFENNRVLLGKTILKGRSLPVWMDYDDFSKHLFIFGDSNQKTCFLTSLLQKISKPWIIFDFKGEFNKLKAFNNISFYDLDSELLRINLFDPKEKSPEEHAFFLLGVFKKIFESDFTVVEKPLSRILSHFCNTNRCKQGLVGLNQAFDEILKGSNPQTPSIIREVANMLHSLQHGILSRVFNNENSNPDLEKLSNEHAVINLAPVISEADINQVKFLLTYIIMSLFKNSPNDEKGIRHITVINDPESGSELINFLIKMFFDKSTSINRGEGLILSASHTKDFTMYDLDSCYRIIFDGVRVAETLDETSGTKLKIENTFERALMVIPGVETPIILYPDYGKISTAKEKINSQIQGNPTKKSPETSSAVSRKTKAEIPDDPDSENSYTLLRENFITADQLLRGFHNSNHVSKSSYNLTGEQIKAFADRISHMLESEVYLTDIHISRITGFPPKVVNKIIREALNTNLEIQRIYVPVVGSKGNIPLYYSKFGPKYENVQDKYLKDNLEELCFKRNINWTVKRDPETGADGKIDSYILKLITQLPKDDELKNIFQKLFLKSSQVAVLFLYDKDLEKAESLNNQWRLPLIMGCLSNLNAFLTEIMETSSGKISNKSYPPDSDLEELISWLKAET